MQSIIGKGGGTDRRSRVQPAGGPWRRVAREVGRANLVEGGAGAENIHSSSCGAFPVTEGELAASRACYTGLLASLAAKLYAGTWGDFCDRAVDLKVGRSR